MSIDFLRSKERELFLEIGDVTEEEAKRLLQELGKECKNVKYEEDYAWINAAIIRWETYLKSQFGEVYITPITKPKQSLKRRLPGTITPCWVFRRPLTELFAHFVLTEPSSSRVATAFASLVFHLLEGINMFDEERKKTIRDLGEIAEALRRPSLRQLARSVIANVDDIDALRTYLGELIDAQRLLPSRITAAFKSNLEKLGIAPGSKILIYGYSELIEPALGAIPYEWRKDINIFVCECRFAWQRADGPLAERTAIALNFPTHPVPEDQIPSLISTKKATSVLMGCRSVGRNGNGAVEVTAFEGSGKVCKWASKKGAKVCIMLAKRKILGQKLYQKKPRPMRLAMLPTISMVSSRWASLGEVGIPRNARISKDYINFFLTENGVFAVNEFSRKYERELSARVPTFTK